jgi:hypothetical protein
MEDNYNWHYGPVTAKQYEQAVAELNAKGL